MTGHTYITTNLQSQHIFYMAKGAASYVIPPQSVDVTPCFSRMWSGQQGNNLTPCTRHKAHHEQDVALNPCLYNKGSVALSPVYETRQRAQGTIRHTRRLLPRALALAWSRSTSTSAWETDPSKPKQCSATRPTVTSTTCHCISSDPCKVQHQ